LFKLADEDAIRAAPQQPLQIGLAHRQWQSAQIVAVHRQHIEGTELNLFVVLAGKQRVEIGDPVNSEDHGLAIDYEPLLTVLQRSLDNPGISMAQS
jgi:hypothetical protein